MLDTFRAHKLCLCQRNTVIKQCGSPCLTITVRPVRKHVRWLAKVTYCLSPPTPNHAPSLRFTRHLNKYTVTPLDSLPRRFTIAPRGRQCIKLSTTCVSLTETTAHHFSGWVSLFFCFCLLYIINYFILNAPFRFKLVKKLA